MTLRHRLFLLVMLIIAIGYPSAAGVFAYISWQSVLERTERDGTLVAQLLAQSISFIRQVPVAIEGIVGNDVQAQADIASNLIQIARKRKASTREINYALRGIAARNEIPEIWVTDAHGVPIFWSLDDIDAAIAVDSGLTRQPAFQALLEGREFNVFIESQRYRRDGRVVYYGGVALPDRSGMVLIAHLLDRDSQVIKSVGLKRMTETVMAAALIDTIWVFDETLKPLVVTSAEGIDKTTTLTATERGIVEQAVRNSTPASHLENSGVHNVLFKHALLYVAAPMFGADGLPDGAALIRLPVNMRAEFHSLLTIGGGLTVVLLLLGMVLALPFLNRIVRPLARLTVQTRRLVERHFDADQEIHAELLKVSENRNDEVGYLGGALYSMVTTLKAYIADLKTTTAAKERIEGELSAARGIQMGMLPNSFVLPGHAECDLHAVLEPAKAVGGDLFDFFLLDEHRLFFLIGDVSDKGVPAALFMAVTKTLFTVEARRDSASVGRIMERVNKALCQNNPEGMFVTVFAGILDLRTGEVTCSDGGHELPFVLRHNGGAEVIEKNKGGLVLGFFADSVYQEEVIRLLPGEGLVIYTDGVTEAMNAQHEMFTATRLNDALAPVCRECPAQTIIDDVMNAVKAFVGGHPQSDDITLLALRWHGPADAGFVPLPEMAGEPGATA
ncbi:MAG TPA: SpoIIE family protein phosphatase [Candidatus Competibacter sp.]|nr:SpoIIE family protein phosphatase [Candidatus Competibacteraceae bacterium]HPE71736.1 SpoIIE family protein phosphatase [Candidatus Competibacter sp.]HRW66497.1 SpoIIE family protein phosphatase [Candidatus Competibacter sp.]